MSMKETVQGPSETSALQSASDEEVLVEILRRATRKGSTLGDVVHREGDERIVITLGDDPILKAIVNAPLDDEPLTDEDRDALREAHEDIEAGRVHTHDEVKKRVGLL